MNLRIRTWVLMAATSVLVPMSLLLLFGFQYVLGTERLLVEAELKGKVSELAYKANERIGVSVQALQDLTLTEAAKNNDWAKLYELAKDLTATNPNFQAVTLVNRNDELVFVTTAPFGPKPFNTNYINKVNDVFLSGKANISGPFKVPISNNWLTAVSYPVAHNGEITHVLRMILRVETLNELLKDVDLPEGWLATIADLNGTVVARSLDPGCWVGKPASASLQAAIRRGERDFYRGVSLEGAPNTAISAPIFQNNWYGVIAVPDKVLEAAYQNKVLWVGSAILLMLTLGFGVAFGGARFMSRQASALEEGVAEPNSTNSLSLRLQITELRKVHEAYRTARDQESLAQHHLVHVQHEKDEITDLYDNAPCGYHSLDPSGLVVRMNQTELNWLGRTREEVVGQPFAHFITEASVEVLKANFPIFLAQGHIEDLEFELLHKDGTSKVVTINGTLIRDAQGRPLMTRSTVFDITARKTLEKRLEKLSNSDALTGLPNRRHFYAIAASEIERSKRHGKVFAVAMLDIDHFKQVNDTHGHANGDLVLRHLATVCSAELRQIDTMARFGGEEFVILMPHTDQVTAVNVLDRLRSAIEAGRVKTDVGVEIGFTVSIGVTAQEPNDINIDFLLKRADAAMYEAKRLGRNQVRVG